MVYYVLYNFAVSSNLQKKTLGKLLYDKIMIGIFDSGIGGLSVFREIRKLMPEESYVYYSDNAHCPYGEKTADYIIGRAVQITGILAGKGADIIVVACNTATAAAISALRRLYSDRSDPEVRKRVLEISGGRRDHIMFIGMEPAVKPAIGLTKTGVIGVLATAGTLKAEKYRNTRELVHGPVKVVEHVGQGFVELVEKGELSGRNAETVVEASLRPLLDAGADVIVLGCTHYPFLLDTIRKIAGPGIAVIDPAPAVAKHLADVMKEDGLPDGCQGKGRVELLSSGPDDNLKAAYAMFMTA